MRENVIEEMRQMQQDGETKRKMLEMLKRVHLEEETNDAEVDDEFEGRSFIFIYIEFNLSQETIQKVLSGNDLNLEDLSPEERKQFQRAITSGVLSKMIEPWEPWWLKPSARAISLRQDGTQLVRPVDDQASSETSLSEIPPGPETPLLLLCELTSRDPYCFTLRLYNGDWRCDPLGAAMVVLSVSAILEEGRQPATVPEALGHCLARTCSPEYKHAGGLRLGQILLDDTMGLLFLGSDALVCLLCDLQRLILAGGRCSGPEDEKGKECGGEEQAQACRQEAAGEAWSSLASLVEVEKASMAAIEEARNLTKVPRRKPLIEEL
ncbi:unnamed protein product [Spirodela intermedia]|uniref:Uncharacterized protein n=1 Tax=Spirodela intermedia TaxID=51605 RepID=A0A7I8IGC4_SPIIN|nr:unnamed protein product [Spirodela intermedia]CAA6656344.1 unnamed protein product [Spirodela intermedia]